MTNKLNHLLVALLAIIAFYPTSAFGQSKLQQYLDGLADSQSTKTRASSTPTDIDLSEFDSDITETVYVRNGINVRFVNGTITRNESLNGPLVKVQDNSKLTVGKGAVLTGKISIIDLVIVDGGSLFCEAGRISDLPSNNSSHISDSPNISAIQDPCFMELIVYYGTVKLMNSNDLFEMTGGFVRDVTSGNGLIKILGGEVVGVQGENIIISGGIVTDVRDEGHVSLDGGEVYNVWGTNVSLSGNITIKNYIYLSREDDIAYLTGSLSGNVAIHTSKKEGETLVIGKDYNITEKDLERIKVVRWENDHKELKLKIVNNEVVIANDNEIKDAQTLQEALDAIASKNIDTWERETIEIPAEGIDIDTPIYFRKNCRVILKGGPIKISSSFKTLAGVPYPYYVFISDAESSVEFQDITLDFNNNNIFKRCLFEISGWFSINNNVVFKGIDNNIDLQYGVFYMKDRCFFNYENYNTELITNSTIFYGEGVQEAYFKGYASSYNKPVINTQSIFNITGGKIQSNYSPYSIKCNYLHIGGDAYVTSNSETVAEADEIYINGGSVSGKCIGGENIWICSSDNYTPYFYHLSKIAVQGKLTLYGKINIICPVSFENANSTVSINQAITCSSKIKFVSPCWKDLVNKPLISGTSNYALPDDILDNFDFNESKYKPVLDKTNNSIYLKKKSLNDFLDGLGGGDTGTEEDPVDIDLPDEENVEVDTHFPGDLQGFLDGLADKENDDDTPKSLKLGGGSLFIDTGCTLTIRNYILDGCSSGKRIYVDGTLVVDINVYIRYFSDYFIYVRKGGRVIWRGGRTEIIKRVIYNEGGTIIIEGGDINAKDGSAIVNIDGTIEIHNGDGGQTTNIYGSIENGNKNNGGIIYIYDGIHYGNITNHGDLYIKGGTVEGYVYTYNNIHLCGCANVGDVYLRGGSTIYVTERLTVKIRINVFIDGDLKDGAFIIVGGDGYTLTEDDLKLLELVLPDGYEWEYDSSQHAIIIKSSTGINGVEMDGNADPSDVYSLKGVKVGTTADKSNIPEGIYIIDGKKTNITPRQ